MIQSILNQHSSQQFVTFVLILILLMNTTVAFCQSCVLNLTFQSLVHSKLEQQYCLGLVSDKVNPKVM